MARVMPACATASAWARTTALAATRYAVRPEDSMLAAMSERSITPMSTETSATPRSALSWLRSVMLWRALEERLGRRHFPAQLVCDLPRALDTLHDMRCDQNQKLSALPV